MPNYFFSCDWGTSSFRLRLAQADSCKVIHELSTNQGIGAILQAYNRQVAEKQVLPEDRLLFYLQYLESQLELLAKQVSFPITGIPVIVSGMASSSIGMLELPYAQLPFLLAGSSAVTHWISASKSFPYDLLLISGLQSKRDVMRGEETQIVGLTTHTALTEAVCIFPGTHSKHIYVRNETITEFRTYMTGELFQTIANHTILQASIEKNSMEESSGFSIDAFRQGVLASVTLDNILHALFTVRTGELFKERSKQQNYYYLSGLLIGKELQDLTVHTDVPVYLCSSSHLLTYYQAAAQVLELSSRTSIVPAQVIDNIVVAGQRQIWQQSL
jgi:2-dehydro-3-deoxygalactonokinase